MNAVRQILWKVLVVGMIPFILGAGLPQMECKCAAAKGQLFCECCFRKPGRFLVEALLPTALGGAKGIAGNTTNGTVLRLPDVPAVPEPEDGKLLLAETRRCPDADQTDRRFGVQCCDAVAADDRE